MPMVMVCPERLSFRTLVENFLNANEDIARDIPMGELIQSWQINKDILQNLEEQKICVKRYGVHNPFSQICTKNITTKDDKRCELLMFLNWIGSIEDEEEQVHECLKESIPRYVAHIITKDERYALTCTSTASIS